MVAVAGLPYPITIAAGALDELGDVVRRLTPDNRAVIFADANVVEPYGRRAAKSLMQPNGNVMVIKVPAGEKTKTRETWASLTDALLEQGFGRDTTIVAVGGGVVGDLIGFVAATFMRGVPVVHVPTTLLAMVDASVGAKTGVDTRFGKNLVGAFHLPAAVLIDPLLLETLPIQHLRGGFAEIVKHGVVADAAYFDRVGQFVEQWPLSGRPDISQLATLIQRSVEIKAGIVARDEREAGLRKVLNFGHTIGHAIEAATEFQTLHGEAVAMGLVAEARMAERLGLAAPGIAGSIERVCRKAGLPTALPRIPVDMLIGFTRTDKKARAGRVEYALPTRIGEMAGGDRGWTVAVDDTVVREALTA